MKEFLLHGFLTNDKLDIIDQKDIYIAVFITEFLHGIGTVALFVTDRFDNLIDEGLTGNIYDTLCIVAVNNVVTDRMHEVSLSETGASIDKQRIVNISGLFCDL